MGGQMKDGLPNGAVLVLFHLVFQPHLLPQHHISPTLSEYSWTRILGCASKAIPSFLGISHVHVHVTMSFLLIR